MKNLRLLLAGAVWAALTAVGFATGARSSAQPKVNACCDGSACCTGGACCR